MRPFRYTMITLSSALIATSCLPLLNAQPVPKAVPPDAPPKAPAQELIERKNDEPSEKIAPDRDAPGLKLTRPNPTDEGLERYSARIVKIVDGKISIQPKDKKDPILLTLTDDAVITLNRQPAKLEDLKAGDYVRVTEAVGQTGVISRVDVGRAPHVGANPTAVKENRGDKTKADNDPERLPSGEQTALGVVLSDSPELGVLIAQVLRDSPAWVAGLHAGDYLMRLDGQSIETPDDYLAVMDNHSPRDSVKMVIWRAGKSFSGTAKVADAANVQDTIVENGLSLLLEKNSLQYEDDRADADSRLRPVEVTETRKPVTVDDGSATRVVDSEDEINIRTYGELIEEHRKLKQRLEALNRQLDRLNAEQDKK